MPIEDLIDLYSRPEVNRISEFVKVAENLDIDSFADAYVNLVQNAPKRGQTQKPYFQTGHDGFPSGTEASNRREEHLALALFNRPTRFSLPDGRDLNIIDYQTPLKSKQSDKGIGKIDLFGVIDNSIPTVIELKINGIKGRKADTPLRALLEGLAYCAIVEANISAIADEAESMFNLRVTQTRPDLIVMAPEDYWQSYLRKPSAGDWFPVFENLIAQIGQKIQISVHLISLVSADFEMGSSEKRPMLKDECCMVSVGQ